MVFVDSHFLLSDRSAVNIHCVSSHSRSSSFAGLGLPRLCLSTLCVLLMWGLWQGKAEAAPQLLKPVVVTGEPVAPNPKDKQGVALKGAGLCGAFRPTTMPLVVFPQRNAGFPNTGRTEFPDAMNAFMDGLTGGLGAGMVDYGTLQTPFDLTNNVDVVGTTSEGDYVNTPGCSVRNGCPFPKATGMLNGGFGTRYRGFINVPPEWINSSVHFGFSADDAVAVTIFSKKDKDSFNEYLVISRAAEIGSNRYRVTNSVKFPKAGLYPIEIVHAQYLLSSVLEFVILASDPSFVDIDESVQAGAPSLLDQRFNLAYTQPAQFFQTSSGSLPFDGQAERCQQCPRMYANQPGQPTNICPTGMFCNEAAVCSPCVGDQFCGNSCEICSSPKPYCARNPSSPNPNDYTCVECRDDTECKTGQKCANGTCIDPCNCCPPFDKCVATDPARPSARNCSECRTDSDCGGRKCDLINGRCADKIPDCNTDERCGKDCVSCPAVSKNDAKGPRPYCLNGEVCVQCRFDVDCKPGTYCRSGDCVPCTHDRHCGPSCRSCGIDFNVGSDGMTVTRSTTSKPFCTTPDGQAETASCVRCLTDAQCGEGGKCDPATRECTKSCDTPCEAGKVCDGTRCVECLTSAQCPCGICVDGACTNNCGDSTDCQGNQCCSKDTGQCLPGRCKPGLTAHGGALCCSTSTAGSTEDPIVPSANRGGLWGLAAAMLLMGTLLRRRRSAGLKG